MPAVSAGELGQYVDPFIGTEVHRYSFCDSADARLYIDVANAAANRTSYDGLPVCFAAITDKPVVTCEITGGGELVFEMSNTVN